VATTQVSALETGRFPQEPNSTSQQQSQHTTSISQAPAFAVQQQAQKAAEQAENLYRKNESFASLFSIPR